MDRQNVTLIFKSLSSGLRLDVYRLLVKQGLNRLVAGETTTAMDIALSNLPFHLMVLTQANQLSVKAASSATGPICR